MTMPEMFSNIYACLVVNYFFTSLACLMLFGVCVGCHLGEPKADARRSIHKASLFLSVLFFSCFFLVTNFFHT